MVSRGAAGLLWDPGLGKSRATLHAYNILKIKKFVKAALIIAPLRVVYDVWPNELEKWRLPLTCVVLHGPDKDIALRQHADLYLINPEGLPWLAAQAKRYQLPFDMLVVDESSKFKSSRAQRFKLLKKMLSRFKRRYILTGSPAPNGLLDLWSQAFILDGGDALFQFPSHYQAQYFYQTGFGGYEWALLPGAEEKIYKKLKPLVLRLAAEDYLELPPLVDSDVEVRLPPDARLFYDRLEAELIAELGDGQVTAANAAVAVQKLRQVTGGAVYLDDADPMLFGSKFKRERDVGLIHRAKLEAVEELLGELEGQPTLVAYEFNHERERLKKLLPLATCLADIKPKDVSAALAAWNRGEIPVMLVQPQSVAHGLNLQGAGRAIVWYSLTWNLEYYEQLIRRIWRQGQTQRVFNYHLICKDTVDETIAAALKRKAKTQNALLSALKGRMKK
jgi:SNF2 family DNA or RNA helicase